MRFTVEMAALAGLAMFALTEMTAGTILTVAAIAVLTVTAFALATMARLRHAGGGMPMRTGRYESKKQKWDNGF